MKKPTKIVIFILFFMLFCSMISATVYLYFLEKQPADTLQEKESVVEKTHSDTKEQEPKEEIIDWKQFATMDFYDTTFPKIGVCAVTAPIGENIISAFSENISAEEKENILQYGTVEENFKSLLSNECDILLSPEPSESILALQYEYGVSLEFVPISNEAIVFLVSYKNTLQNLYLEDIQNIYSGKITSWETFTGKDEKIIPYQKKEDSLLQSIFYHTVLEKEKTMQPPNHFYYDAQKNLVSSVAFYDGGQSAIGYDTYYYASDILYDYGVKMIAIDGIYPTKKNIINGIYPIMTNYYAVIRKTNHTDAPEQKMIQYLTSQVGQELIQKSGFLPMIEL